MFSSIVLLLTLQILWLRNAYREAADNFRKETNMLFLNTVRSIQDTLIRESIIPYNGDTLAYHKLMPGPVHDSLKIMATTRAFFNDSTLPGKDPVRIQVYYINGKPDQVEEMLSPVMKKIREASPHKNFLIRLNADSLNADTLRVHYQAELAKSGIEIPFTIVSEMAGKNNIIRTPA